jgi:hypothetical protein
MRGASRIPNTLSVELPAFLEFPWHFWNFRPAQTRVIFYCKTEKFHGISRSVHFRAFPQLILIDNVRDDATSDVLLELFVMLHRPPNRTVLLHKASSVRTECHRFCFVVNSHV